MYKNTLVKATSHKDVKKSNGGFDNLSLLLLFCKLEFV